MRLFFKWEVMFFELPGAGGNHIFWAPRLDLGILCCIRQTNKHFFERTCLHILHECVFLTPLQETHNLLSKTRFWLFYKFSFFYYLLSPVIFRPATSNFLSSFLFHVSYQNSFWNRLNKIIQKKETISRIWIFGYMKMFTFFQFLFSFNIFWFNFFFKFIFLFFGPLQMIFWNEKKRERAFMHRT